MNDYLLQLLEHALVRRQPMLAADHSHRQMLRLFNGFTEGVPELAIDLMARTAVIHDYSQEGALHHNLVEFLTSKLDFLQAVLLKRRNTENLLERNGVLIYGDKPDTFVEENHIRYAVDLTMNHDNGFYGDTRNLRKYLLENMQGKRVLNTFAYTGSLGVAAAVGGAEYVLQTDLSGKFMQQAYRSASLNGFAFTRRNFRVGDFFPVTAALRKEHTRFDCVIVDPPFFSSTRRGVVDLANNPMNVVNKVRPLVAGNGILIVVNNSLYLPGEKFLSELRKISHPEFMSLETVIPIPDDYCFAHSDELKKYPADPAPFNHPTKIAVLRLH